MGKEIQTSRSKGQRKKILLNVALDHFSRKSYSEARIQDIAQQADVAYSLLYYYYKNKDELFHAAVSYSMNLAIDHYKILEAEHKSPIALIQDWLESNVTHSNNLKLFFKIVMEFSARRNDAPSLADEVDYFYKFEKKLLVENIRKGVEIGEFSCQSPEEVADFISCHIDGIYHRALVRPDFSIAKAMDGLEDQIWIMLRADVQKPK